MLASHGSLPFLRPLSRRQGLSPNLVLLRTALRKRSPELTAESWGKRCMRRSACVPFPTPGAPTRIMRAARLKSRVDMVGLYKQGKRSGGPREIRQEGRRVATKSRNRSSRLRYVWSQHHCDGDEGMYISYVQDMRLKKARNGRMGYLNRWGRGSSAESARGL